MRVTDAAKQGRSQSVIEAVENGSVTDLQLLLRKVCQDYHTIKKHDGHLELVRFLLSVGAKAEVEMVCEAARGGHEKLINALVDGGLPSDLFVAATFGDAAAVQGHLALEGLDHRLLRISTRKERHRCIIVVHQAFGETPVQPNIDFWKRVRFCSPLGPTSMPQVRIMG
jgi:hypothetical protein